MNKIKLPTIDLIGKKNKLEEMGWTFISQEYNVFSIRCKNGHVYRKNFNLLKMTNYVCCKCLKDKKIFEKQTKEYENLGFKVLYIDKKELKLECKEGHNFNIKNNSIKYANILCPKCKNEENK